MKATLKIFFKLFVLLLLCRQTMNSLYINVHSSLRTLNVNGHFSFNNISHAAKDFGNRYSFSPLSVLHPASVSDIATTISHIYKMGPNSNIKIAARGHGHSLQGQSQALNGIVIQMESLQEQKIHVVNGEILYVEASGGELWINVLKESLKYGVAPKSWTDYLYLTVGGTLSNAGVSGQAFMHGPQISNVLQLEVVTGKGEIRNCSEKENADLFFAVLGGLGQFGIITKARIALEPAPKMVKWIRVLYSDFRTFTEDQEMLISKEKTFDYIEGFVIINRTGILNNWRSSFNPDDPVQASKFRSEGKILFCLELTKNFDPYAKESANKEVEELLSQLRYIPSTLFQSDVTYLKFLDRVHTSELQLRSKGLWDVPHPWLNLLIPRSKIYTFSKEVFGNILTDSSNGPILMYPVHKSKWDSRTSVVLPDEGVFYLVGILTSANDDSLAKALKQNEKILEFCENSRIGMKQYLPHYNRQEEWKQHFGSNWEIFLRRKQLYDPHKILAPGQRIFYEEMLSLDI